MKICSSFFEIRLVGRTRTVGKKGEVGENEDPTEIDSFADECSRVILAFYLLLLVLNVRSSSSLPFDYRFSISESVIFRKRKNINLDRSV